MYLNISFFYEFDYRFKECTIDDPEELILSKCSRHASEKARMTGSRCTLVHVAPAGTVIHLVNSRGTNESRPFPETGGIASGLK